MIIGSTGRAHAPATGQHVRARTARARAPGGLHTRGGPGGGRWRVEYSWNRERPAPRRSSGSFVSSTYPRQHNCSLSAVISCFSIFTRTSRNRPTGKYDFTYFFFFCHLDRVVLAFLLRARRSVHLVHRRFRQPCPNGFPTGGGGGGGSYVTCRRRSDFNVVFFPYDDSCSSSYAQRCCHASVVTQVFSIFETSPRVLHCSAFWGLLLHTSSTDTHLLSLLPFSRWCSASPRAHRSLLDDQLAFLTIGRRFAVFFFCSIFLPKLEFPATWLRITDVDLS